MAKLIDSPKFGKLKVMRVDPDIIKGGDIITTYQPDIDALPVYQYTTVHSIVSNSEVLQYSEMVW